VNIKKSDNNQIEGRFSKTARFILNAKPFRLDLFTNDIFVMSVNSKNMFNFEHYRIKPEYEEFFYEKIFYCIYLDPMEHQLIPKLVLKVF
jgi:hypothetical protein